MEHGDAAREDEEREAFGKFDRIPFMLTSIKAFP